MEGGIELEEDIKILEELIEEYKDCSVKGLDMQVDVSFREKQCNAIKHLIKRYKQLEEENKELKHITQNYNAYQQKSDNPNTTIIIADEKWFINGYFKENFIPKSKVKEKIEELKEDEEFYREHDRMYQFESKIKLLQKLLED